MSPPRLGRLELPPRLTDWTILAVLVLEGATGLLSLVAGRPADAWVFAVHGAGGLALVVLLVWKLRRVRGRVARRPDRSTALSVLLALIAVATLATGAAWVHGGDADLGAWTLLNVHIGLGLLLGPLLLYHLRRRWRLPRRRDVEGRRTVLQYLALAAVGALAWRLQGVANDLLGVGGRRFTGSKPEGSHAGNAFPVTSWVADDPEPVDADAWTLRVGGLVERDLALGSEELPTGAGDAVEKRAVLDCTSGWYSEHDWRGVRVGDLLDAAGAGDEARWVRFRSVTGYRWSLPVEEARGALLATHVDGERLSHGHGFPLRLVAPGRRGFQWVKWVTAVDVRRRRDPGQWLAVFLSGLDGE